MKNLSISGLLMLSLFSCQKAEVISPKNYTCNFNFEDSSQAHPRRAKYQTQIDGMTKNGGVVGISMSVQDQDGLWLGCSGKADLYNDIDLQPCHITRVGSTVKMYTATLILKLQEEGKLNLDQKIAEHLSGDPIKRIKNAEKATIRQLLQHSSGIYNYIQNAQFQTASINNLIKEWHAEDLLQYAYDKPAYFEPDADIRYSNTNYILLGLLIEKIEGKALYQVFDEKIFQPLKLKHTSFAGKNPVPQNIIRGYIDLYSNLQVIESTYYSGWDYYTADGGLISNPYDMTVFFRALMAGKIINPASLQTMLSWRTPKEQDSEFYPIQYGLGIFRMETPRGVAYFHSGDAIGYYANMLYFPADGTTVVYAVNSNYGKIDQAVSTKNAMEKIILVTKK